MTSDNNDFEQAARDHAEGLHPPLADLERSRREWNEFDDEAVLKYWRARKIIAKALSRADERMESQHWKIGPERILSDLQQSITYLMEAYEQVDSQTQVEVSGLDRSNFDLLDEDWYDPDQGEESRETNGPRIDLDDEF